MSRVFVIAALAAAVSAGGCSSSDLAYMMEADQYPDQTIDDMYLSCPTGDVVIVSGVSGGQWYGRAINRTQRRIGINFKSRFGGDNQYFANPGETTETLWRSPIDAQGAANEVDCDPE